MEANMMAVNLPQLKCSPQGTGKLDCTKTTEEHMLFLPDWTWIYITEDCQ